MMKGTATASPAQTSLGAALIRAGYPIDKARLAAAATNILAKHGDTPRALAAFEEMLQSDRALLRALAADYLEDRATDMRGAELRGGANQGVPLGFQRGSAPAAQPHDDDAGRTSIALAGYPMSAPSSSPVPSGGGQTGRASRHSSFASSARIPNPPRGLAAIASIQPTIARSILDTFRVRDGRAIGDLQWHELTALAARNEREATVLRRIAGYSQNVDPDAFVRDVVRPAYVEDVLKEVQEAGNDAE